MTITKEILKKEIDLIPDNYITILYKIMKSFEEDNSSNNANTGGVNELAQFYGSFKDAPIERGDQPKAENREEF